MWAFLPNMACNENFTETLAVPSKKIFCDTASSRSVQSSQNFRATSWYQHGVKYIEAVGEDLDSTHPFHKRGGLHTKAERNRQLRFVAYVITQKRTSAIIFLFRLSDIKWLCISSQTAPFEFGTTVSISAVAVTVERHPISDKTVFIFQQDKCLSCKLASNLSCTSIALNSRRLELLWMLVLLVRAIYFLRCWSPT